MHCRPGRPLRRRDVHKIEHTFNGILLLRVRNFMFLIRVFNPIRQNSYRPQFPYKALLIVQNTSPPKKGGLSEPADITCGKILKLHYLKQETPLKCKTYQHIHSSNNNANRRNVRKTLQKKRAILSTTC